MKKPQRVLFVCIGNSCRSQMAEAFTRAHGRSVVAPASAGIYPAFDIAPDTRRAMAEKNIPLDGQFPKSIEQVDRPSFDLIVDMTGGALEAENGEPIRRWDIPDPIVMSYQEHRHVRDGIELLVLDLIAELSKKKKRRLAIGW